MRTTWEQLHSSEGMANEKRTSKHFWTKLSLLDGHFAIV